MGNNTDDILNSTPLSEGCILTCALSERRKKRALEPLPNIRCEHRYPSVVEARVFLVAVCVVTGLDSLGVSQRSGTALSEKTPSISLLGLSNQKLTSLYSG